MHRIHKAAIIAGFFLGIMVVVYGKDLKPALNNVVESLEQLIAIKNSDLSSTEKDSIETEAKKTAFNRILELSIEEVKNLKKKLEQFSNFPKEEFILLNQSYVSSLSDYQSYYELVRQQVNKNISLNELVDLAQKLQNWRETNYHKQINKITNFILIIQNQSILQVTENRLRKISRDSKAIKSLLKITKWNEADALLEEAGGFVKKARKINDDAQDLFLNQEVKQSDSKIESLIKESTENITKAYQNFINLGELVNNNPRF